MLLRSSRVEWLLRRWEAWESSPPLDDGRLGGCRHWNVLVTSGTVEVKVERAAAVFFVVELLLAEDAPALSEEHDENYGGGEEDATVNVLECRSGGRKGAVFTYHTKMAMGTPVLRAVLTGFSHVLPWSLSLHESREAKLTIGMVEVEREWR